MEWGIDTYNIKVQVGLPFTSTLEPIVTHPQKITLPP